MNERELFKWAYLNLRGRDSIPFPDAVFDEYLKLREAEGYKLVPVEPTDTMIEVIASNANCCGGIAYDVYKAVIGAIE